MTKRFSIIAIFLISFSIYLSNIYSNYKKDFKEQGYRNLAPSGDVIPNTFLPYQIIKSHTLKFNEIRFFLRNFDDKTREPYFFYTNKDDQTFSVYPIMSGLFALPTYFIPIMLNKIPALVYHINILKILMLGRITASFYTALSVVIMYLVLSRISKNKRLVILFTIFYAFGTTTLSISSRGMWQHTISEFLNAIILLLLLKAEEKPSFYKYIGFLLGLAVLTRPTNFLIAAPIALYVFLKKRKYFTTFFLYTIPSIAFLLIYNNYAFGSPFSEGYGAQNGLLWNTPLWYSLPSYFINPARGFLFISPPLLLSFITMYRSLKKDYLYKYLSIGCVLTMVLYGMWNTWDGANGFGYRMLTDIVPFLTLFAFEEAARIKNRRVFLVISFLILYSCYVHLNAIYFKKGRCDRNDNWTFKCLSPGIKLRSL